MFAEEPGDFGKLIQKGRQKSTDPSHPPLLQRLGAHQKPAAKTKENTMPEANPIDQEIIADKTLRKQIDQLIQDTKALPASRERSLCITKLQEGVMWLGMDLKRINEQTGVGENPYPNSKDPSNTKIEPTADGLTL